MYVVSVSANVEIAAQPYKTTYSIGESLDLTGGTIKRSYTEFLSNGVSIERELEELDMTDMSYWRDGVYTNKDDFDNTHAGFCKIVFGYTKSGSTAYAELTVEVKAPATTTTTTTTTFVQSVSAKVAVGRCTRS